MNAAPDPDKLLLIAVLTGVITEVKRSERVTASAIELITKLAANHSESQELRDDLAVHLNSVYEKQAKRPYGLGFTDAELMEVDVARKAIELLDKAFSALAPTLIKICDEM